MLLNCHTYYSINYGTLSVEGLFSELQSKGYDSFVISDINTTSACIEVARQCAADKEGHRERNFTPLMGIDFRNGIRQQYVGIAINNDGFRELNEHLSSHLHSNEPFGDTAPAFTNAFVVYPLCNYKGRDLRENEFIGVSRRDLAMLPFSAAASQRKKLVILQTLTFAEKKHFNMHRLLRAIDNNTILSKLPQKEQARPDETVPFREDLLRDFAAWPEAIENTRRILSSCRVDFGFGKFANKTPANITGSLASDIATIRDICYRNLPCRYKKAGNTQTERLEKELGIIENMKFASYFLINYDIVNYARSRGFYYVGRGSGANSIVAYLLRVTDVDPIELDLYFERFINPARTNPPDFDIDFSWTDRDEITDYIFRRYGDNGRVALLGSYNTYQRDAVLRQLGKVFGLPPSEIGRLQAGDQMGGDDISRLVLRYSDLLQDFPAHLSIHSSGILISQEPISCYGGTFMPPKGFPTTQFSMLEAEDIGLYKFDILSQRGLGKIKDTLDIVKENRGIAIDIHDVDHFKRDEKVKELLRCGNTTGCFYVESPAMRMLLAKLRADDYLRLVAASSIIRPGVSKSGMMREYILRFRHEHLREKARQEIPELYEILRETYGVMVYQEDVIRVAHQFAGLSLAEADYLRRGMSWKFKQRNEFRKVKENFVVNCRKKGCNEKSIQDIWNQIESFANFAFSKGHSASYAVESYQALYLKAHYPLEYMTATLNNGGGFYRTELYIHEARMQGADIQPPCVNKSVVHCRIENRTICIGLGRVAGLELELQERIISERSAYGCYRNLPDFVTRVAPSLEQLRLLIRIGAFRFTGKSKKELMWEAQGTVSPGKKTDKVAKLFEPESRKYELPKLTDMWYDDAFDEIELLGFSLSSPFGLLREPPEVTIKARDLIGYIGKYAAIVGYMISVKNTYTSKGEGMYFGTFIDVNGHWIDTVHFPPVARAYPFKGPGCYKITGRVVEEFDFISIEVTEIERLAVIDREAEVLA